MDQSVLSVLGWSSIGLLSPGLGTVMLWTLVLLVDGLPIHLELVLLVDFALVGADVVGGIEAARDGHYRVSAGLAITFCGLGASTSLTVKG